MNDMLFFFGGYEQPEEPDKKDLQPTSNAKPVGTAALETNGNKEPLPANTKAMLHLIG